MRAWRGPSIANFLRWCCVFTIQQQPNSAEFRPVGTQLEQWRLILLHTSAIDLLQSRRFVRLYPNCLVPSSGSATMAGSSRNQLKNIATSSSHPLNAVAKAATRQLGKAIAGEQKSGRRVTKKYITEGQKEVRADIRRQAERPAFGIRTKRVTDRDQKRRLAQRFPIPAMRSDAPSLKALELPHGRTVNVKRHGKPKRSTVVRFRDREYGRHIFIYNHLTTNQVVYSFTEELQVSFHYAQVSVSCNGI